MCRCSGGLTPERPNPIAVTAAAVTFVDADRGILGLGWIDANGQTPVLDIKPYTPSADRVEHPTVPDWCAHWPKAWRKAAHSAGKSNAISEGDGR